MLLVLLSHSQKYKSEVERMIKMKWQKLGLLYDTSESGRHPKLISHAANPLPLLIADDVYRVFFNGRDANNRSSVGAVDIDIVKRQVIKNHHHPFFEHGQKNSFFANGVSIGNCYEANGVRYMLFMGWQNPEVGHWFGEIGRLIVTPELTLELDSSVPFIACDTVDPISLSYPCVLAKSPSGFNMWYGSTITWDAGNEEMLHIIRHASSADGQHWHRNGEIAVPYELGNAQAFSRPIVIQDGHDNFKMWFSFRGGFGKKYRIGYATSHDGLTWQLELAQIGISVSNSGWDSEMIEYPFVFDHKGERYMLYNGNGYGKTGFGLAILEQN